MQSAEFSQKGRTLALERASENRLDLLVVGGGITGAGIAREAALRRLRTLIVDKGDFASGTSSRSSKLIHGGLRYLAQGDVGLVREAARERAVLRRLAPHLAQPLRMLMPVSSFAGRAKMSAALWTFMRLAGGHDRDGYETLDRAATVAAEPGLRRESLSGCVRFTEFLTDDARLTLETVKSAAQAGALAASYAEVTAITGDGDGLRVTLEDRIDGGSTEVRCRCLVNAAGPWFDRVRGLHDDGARKLVQLTRGIHLVVPADRLPCSNVVVLKSPDGRSTFVVPRGPVAYIGTTDTYYDGPAEEPGVTETDVSYLLESVAATFAEAPARSDIVATWSGVRPLLAQEGKKPSEVSRRDEIMVGPGPVVSIVGGKLTTYRCMAERVIREVYKVLGASPELEPNSAELALAGGDEQAQQRARAASASLGAPVLEDRLWNTYGVAAADVLERMRAQPDSMEPLGGLSDFTLAEADYAVDCEMAMTVDDLLRRRCRAAMFDTQAALAAVPAAAELLARRLGWSAERAEREAAGLTALAGEELRIARGENGG